MLREMTAEHQAPRLSFGCGSASGMSAVGGKPEKDYAVLTAGFDPKVTSQADHRSTSVDAPKPSLSIDLVTNRADLVNVTIVTQS